MILRFAFTLIFVFLSLSKTTYSTDFIGSDNGIFCYKFQKGAPLPDQFSNTVKPMYFETYDPALHEKYSLERMGLDQKFNTYEEFLYQLIEDDFRIYATDTDRIIFFATQHECKNNYENICGLCVFLPGQQKGEYYLDHIGIKDTFKRQGIGRQLLNLAMRSIAAEQVTLDTRVFNVPAQNFYEKEGFAKISPHPILKKEGFYFRYAKRM